MEKKEPLITSSVKNSPPPSYAQEAVDITAGFASLNLGSTTTKPTVDQCVAHLKLLEAFHQLREDVSTNDGLFGISDQLASLSSKGDKGLATVREKRWAVYVARAADRFESWWDICVPARKPRLRQRDIAAPNFQKCLDDQQPLDCITIPPLGEFFIVTTITHAGADYLVPQMC